MTSSSTSSAGQGGTGQGGTGQGGTGGGTTGVEICNDQIDNDNDGLIDCGDWMDCTEYTCAPPVPIGWVGPVWLYRGSDASLPSCGPLDTGVDAFTGQFLAAPASCGACSCSAPSGGTCAPPSGEIEEFSDSGCTFSAGNLNVLQPGCTTSTTTSTYSVIADVKSTATGQCAPQGGNVTLPPATFSEKARVCINPPIGAGCDDNAACVPKAPPPFDPAVCIYQETGNMIVPCPMVYPNQFVLYGGVTDTRGCTDCQCGFPIGRTCPIQLNAYANNSCAIPPTPVPSGVCTGFTSPALSFHGQITGSPTGGQCAVSQYATPTGNVLPAGPKVVCCQ